MFLRARQRIHRARVGGDVRGGVRHRVRDIDDDAVGLVGLDGRAGEHAVHDEHRFLHAIGCAVDGGDGEVVEAGRGWLANDGADYEVVLRGGLEGRVRSWGRGGRRRGRRVVVLETETKAETESEGEDDDEGEDGTEEK